MPMFFHFASAPVEIPPYFLSSFGSPMVLQWNLARHTPHDPQALPLSLNSHCYGQEGAPEINKKCLSPEGTEVTVEAANQTQAANCEPRKRESNP